MSSQQQAGLEVKGQRSRVRSALLYRLLTKCTQRSTQSAMPSYIHTVQPKDHTHAERMHASCSASNEQKSLCVQALLTATCAMSAPRWRSGSISMRIRPTNWVSISAGVQGGRGSYGLITQLCLQLKNETGLQVVELLLYIIWHLHVSPMYTLMHAHTPSTNLCSVHLPVVQ